MTGEAYDRPAAIATGHDTSGFSCGNDGLDDWLRTTALKAEGNSARTYVVTDGEAVVGYYSLATGSVARGAAPGKVRRNAPEPIPVLIIGRLAVDRRCQGQGIGGGMLRDALQRAFQASIIVGCRAILVHAVDSNAVAFYARYGFIEYPGGTRTMFLPLETLRQTL